MGADCRSKLYKTGEKKRNNRKCSGITLLEVLLALVITGILSFSTLRLVVAEWKQNQELKDSLEMQYSLTVSGKKISDAIRSARSVYWNGKALEIIPWSVQGNPPKDLYYVDDKDADGIQDLYCEHLGVPSPLASHITQFSCSELNPGLWQMKILASLHSRTQSWQEKIRQRAIPVESDTAKQRGGFR